MLFHEIYGSYYNAIAKLLSSAQNGELNDIKMKEIVDNFAFGESFMEIIPAIKNEKWRLIKSDFTTPLKHTPTLPLTTLQKRWLKAISLDKRIKLFNVNFDFLNGVEPLFTPEDFYVFDKYSDSDPFEDSKYILVFRTILEAIKSHKKICAEYLNINGNRSRITGIPQEIEYSEKDDKFRVNIRGRFLTTLNISRIKSCEIIGNGFLTEKSHATHSQEYFIAELKDQRNAMERFLLHFAHFKKEAEQLDNKSYRIKIYYDKSDKTELVIRVLSFGPFVKVTEPIEFVNLIKERLIMQKSCGLK